MQKKVWGIEKRCIFAKKILVPDTAYRIKVIGDDTFDSALIKPGKVSWAFFVNQTK